MSSNAPTASKGGPPVGLVFFLSLAAGIIWIGALLLQIATSEAQVTGHSIRDVVATLGILNQWPSFVHGELSPTQTAAFIYGWGLEIFVLFFVTMYEIVSHALKRGHSLLPKLFMALLIICFLLDIGSDYNYLPPSLGFWTRIIVALILAASVAFMGVGAFAGFEYCIKNW